MMFWCRVAPILTLLIGAYFQKLYYDYQVIKAAKSRKGLLFILRGKRYFFDLNENMTED